MLYLLLLLLLPLWLFGKATTMIPKMRRRQVCYSRGASALFSWTSFPRAEHDDLTLGISLATSRPVARAREEETGKRLLPPPSSC